MKQLLILVVTTLAIMELANGSPEDDINGEWTNELGSNVTFRLTNGHITGTYQTAVVSDQKKNQIPDPTPLYGTYQLTEDGILLTFAVQWKFQNKEGQTVQSETTWIGKFYREDRFVFDTTWLLVGNAKKADSWGNVQVNRDSFTKIAK